MEASTRVDSRRTRRDVWKTNALIGTYIYMIRRNRRQHWKTNNTVKIRPFASRLNRRGATDVLWRQKTRYGRNRTHRASAVHDGWRRSIVPIKLLSRLDVSVPTLDLKLCILFYESREGCCGQKLRAPAIYGIPKGRPHSRSNYGAQKSTNSKAGFGTICPVRRPA